MRSDRRDKPSGSVIISALDRFCEAVYVRLTGGALGTAFSKYPDVSNTLFERLSESKLRSRFLTPARRAIASKLEDSAASSLYGRLVRYLLCGRMRVFGVFLFSFLVYSAIFAALGFFRQKGDDPSSFVVPAIAALGCVPLLASKRTLAQSLASSRFGEFVLKLTGTKVERLDLERLTGRGDLALILALALALFTLAVPFWAVLLALAALCGLLVIFASPEFGTICLFFFMPILPTALLCALAVLVFVSFILKALLARRVFRVEAIDVALFPFILTLIGGTLFGAAGTSLASGAVFTVFCACFYVTVFTLTTREWIRRAAIAMVISCALVSAYGIVQYFTQSAVGNAVENGWIDEKMFGYITARATATLDNPNMLSVYLIIVLPTALCAIITLARTAFERLAAIASFGIIAACLALTWTRGAWLGAIVAIVILVMVWSRRSLYMFIAGLAAFPFLPYILPANIWARFSSIGNMMDSSSAYRVNILKSAGALLPRFTMNGLGFGEESWFAVWLPNALKGVETTQHTHNLYIQIWLQTGLISLIMFLIFIALLFLSNFNFFRLAQNANDSVMSHVSIGPMKEAPQGADGDGEKTASGVAVEKKKTALRLEAAAPACGIFAALLMGFTDYIWYNYRVLLIFWLVCGLSSANVRVGRRELEYKKPSGSPTEATAEIPIKTSGRKRRNG